MKPRVMEGAEEYFKELYGGTEDSSVPIKK